VVPALFGPQGIVGGAERYALELARHMAARVPTRMVTFGPERRTESVDGLRIDVLRARWHPRGQRTNSVAPELLRHLVGGASVVHCHQRYVVASSVAALVGSAVGKRVFVSDLGGGGWDISTRLPVARLYRGFLHISEYSRRVAGQEAEPRARVILGGVDARRFSPGPGTERGREALFVGRILPHKGVDDLVDAAGDDLPLRVIGQPYDLEYLARLKIRAGSKPVAWVHGATDEALVRAYREALCVVLPSVYRSRDGQETLVPELLGQTLLEGMACGAPAVCTAVASMPEVVVDGVTGLMVPANDPAALGGALRWLRDHPARAAEMGAAGRRRVEEVFTWPAVVERCLDAYSTL
jgi:glycosyltransferase involved in cell wall biosynthesis